MRIIALLALCFAAVAAVPKNPQRIIGGSYTTIDQYPSMAALLFSNTGFRQACGGTIINNRSVLTAAQCTSGYAASRWRVRVGSTYANSGGDVHNAQTIINHPSYNVMTLNNDLAIIRVSPAFWLNYFTIAPAYIADSNYDLVTNAPVWATGWGRQRSGGTNSEQLRHVQIWVVAQSHCSQRYAPIGSTITDNMLCAGWLDFAGRAQCWGDEGGPIYHNGVVVGVYSWGYFPCNTPRYPGVHTRVTRYTSWIQANA